MTTARPLPTPPPAIRCARLLARQHPEAARVVGAKMRELCGFTFDRELLDLMDALEGK